MWVKIPHTAKDIGCENCHLRWGDVSQNKQVFLTRTKCRSHLRWGDVSQNQCADSMGVVEVRGHLRWGDVSQNLDSVENDFGSGIVISGEEMWVKISETGNMGEWDCVISGEEMWVKIVLRSKNYKTGESSPVRRCESKLESGTVSPDGENVISGEEMWVKISPSTLPLEPNLCHLRWGDVSQNLSLVGGWFPNDCHLRWGDVSQNPAVRVGKEDVSRHLRWGDVSQNSKKSFLSWADRVISGEEMWVKIYTKRIRVVNMESSPVRRCESKLRSTILYWEYFRHLLLRRYETKASPP